MQIVSNKELGYWAISHSHVFRLMTGRNSGVNLYVAIGGGRYLQFNLGVEPDERVAWQLGSWAITRPETEEEAEEPAYAYAWEEQDEAIEEIETDWFTHPSLTTEQRNATLN